MNQIIALCRPGFENDCANELLFFANKQQLNVYVKAKPNSGYIQLVCTDNLPGSASSALSFIQTTEFNRLIFTRQWFFSPCDILLLPEQDRISVILEIVKQHSLSFSRIALNHTDTNDGKSLSKFCKQFLPHLEKALHKTPQLKRKNPDTLNLLFLDSTHVFIGINLLDNSATHPMGIPRLRFPSSAPSRSTLKLEEAINTFIKPETQDEILKPGMSAVDLGAAPGGWTWQLVKRQIFVTAIDNGPMDKDLMRSGMVEHLRVDAFGYTQKKVDWLVCDMVEQPHRVSKLIAKWFTGKRCLHAIFNLKLPMNKRYDAVKQCEKILTDALNASGIKYQMQIKQLYHDREEVTVCILSHT